MRTLTTAFIVTVSAVGVAWVLYVVLPFMWGRYLRYRLGRCARRAGILALTFDDGPGRHLTPEVLRILAEHNVRASFFVLGRNVAGREDLVRRLARDGHDICSHGFDHVRQSRSLPGRTIRDIRHGWRTLDAALGCGTSVYPFRPPHGRLNLAGLLYLWRHRVPILYWSIDSGDTFDRTRRQASRAACELARQGGGVVLLHDFDRTDADTGQMVLDSLRHLLATAEERHLRVMPISEFLRQRSTLSANIENARGACG